MQELNPFLAPEQLAITTDILDLSALLKRAMPSYSENQAQLIVISVIKHFCESANPIFVQSHTGTGKSWLIIMVAVYLLKNYNLNIVIVAPTCYLTGRSYEQFRPVFSLLEIPVAREVLGAKVCFITSENLMKTPLATYDPKHYALLIDEADREIFDRAVEKKTGTIRKFIFKSAFLSAFAKVICLSGSIGGIEEGDVMRAHYFEPKIISVPRLQNS